MRLGVIEYGSSIMIEDRYHHEVINDLFELATFLDENGYNKLWLSEHHNDGVAWGSPEILISILAGGTSNLRIGSAGVQIVHHSPMRLAENFKMLEAVYPNRIDLGIATGVTDRLRGRALLDKEDYDGPKKEDINRKIEELIGFLTNGFKEDHPYYPITIPPAGYPSPAIWTLSTGKNAIDRALKLETNMCLSLAHNSESIPSPDLMTYFLEHNTGNKEASLHVGGIVADSEKEALAIEKKFRSKHLRHQNFAINFVGSPTQVKEQLDQLIDSYKADDIVFVDMCNNMSEKLYNYTILKELYL